MMKSKETSSQREPVRNSCVAIMQSRVARPYFRAGAYCFQYKRPLEKPGTYTESDNAPAQKQGLATGDQL